MKRKLGEKPPKSQPVSDSSKLLYTELMAPMVGAINALQQQAGQLQNLIALRMAKMDNVDTNDGWMLDPTTMRWMKKEPT